MAKDKKTQSELKSIKRIRDEDKPLAYFNAMFDEGALTSREKALIALAVGSAIDCDHCLDVYRGACLDHGVDPSEMVEALEVAAAIRGGALLSFGLNSLHSGRRSTDF